MPESTTNANARYGQQTKLGLNNFGSEEKRLADCPAFLRNYALVKIATARANEASFALEHRIAKVIEQATWEVHRGQHNNQFPTALVVGGGGTITNMNINEVIAQRASQILGEPVDPLEHVNMSQSTNDTYATAAALTIMDKANEPYAEVTQLIKAIEAKAEEFGNLQRLGRTSLQDAVTLTVRDTHRSQAAALRRTATALRDAARELRVVPIGATVLGTQVGAPEGYNARVALALSDLTDMWIEEAQDPFDTLAHLDKYAGVASAGAQLAMTMARIASDFRLLASGPKGGFGEIILPEVQARSAMLPAKNAPVIPEYVMQLSYRVRGTATTVELAAAAGELELNVMKPVVVDALLSILTDLTAMAHVFREKCITGLVWNKTALAANVAAIPAQREQKPS